MQDGTAAAKLTLATTETYRLKNGEQSTHTERHTIIAWRWLATLLHHYANKGSLLFVEGKIRSRQFQDNDRQKNR